MHKVLSRTLAALVGVAMPFALAAPASASPEDGEGCAGLQSNPKAYVCVVSLDPGALPGVGGTGSTTLFSDTVCYVAGCREVTVTVPNYGVEYPDGALLVVYYDGQYHSVGLVPVGVPPTGPYFTLVSNVLGLALDLALDIAGDVGETGDWNAIRWLDCVVESETNDQVNISSSSSFSGYDLQTCNQYYFIL